VSCDNKARTDNNEEYERENHLIKDISPINISDNNTRTSCNKLVSIGSISSNIISYTDKINIYKSINRIKEDSEIIYKEGRYDIPPNDLSLITQAAYWCEMNTGMDITKILNRARKSTALFEVANILANRATPEQSGFNSIFQIKKATILTKWKRTKEAEKIYKIIIEKEKIYAEAELGWGNYVEANHLLARLYSNAGKYEDAMKYYQNALNCNIGQGYRTVIQDEINIMNYNKPISR